MRTPLDWIHVTVCSLSLPWMVIHRDTQSAGAFRIQNTLRHPNLPNRVYAFSATANENDGVYKTMQTQLGVRHKEWNDEHADRETETASGDQLTNDDNPVVVSGSVSGAALLFAGTAIGAGMLALPAETASAGFVPSLFCLVLCWTFTVLTSYVTVEASVASDAARRQRNGPHKSDMLEEPQSGSFLAIVRTTGLGYLGNAASVALFWFLLTSILVAYTSQGGQIVKQLVQLPESFYSDNKLLNPVFQNTLFIAAFTVLGTYGTDIVDRVNRVLMIGLVASFLSLVIVALPGIHTENLARSDWTVIYPNVISIGILSFGAQNVVPTLLEYLGGDPIRTRRAVLIGSTIPLFMYSIWEAVFLGAISYNDLAEGSKMSILTSIGDAGGWLVNDIVQVFSACAIGSSMAGASVSLIDFFQEAIETASADDVFGEVASNYSKHGSRLLGALFALAPPLVLACAFPDAFLGALENAGLIGGVSLYGLIPALVVLKYRRKLGKAQNPPDVSVANEVYTPLGGSLLLYAICAVSVALVFPEFVRLGQGLWS